MTRCPSARAPLSMLVAGATLVHAHRVQQRPRRRERHDVDVVGRGGVHGCGHGAPGRPLHAHYDVVAYRAPR